MKKHTIATLVASLFTTGLSAQAISIPGDTIDCGQVEYRHAVKAEFKMRNSGRLPLVIHDVSTSCGCTKASYPSAPVAPDSAFTVSAVYDAKTMGHFQKQIAVMSNASAEPLVLTLKGVVVERITDFEGKYPFTIGGLKTDRNELEFDDVNRGDMPVAKIHLANSSDETLEPQLMHLPPYLHGEVSPARIAPGHTGTAVLQVDSRKLQDLGLTQTSIFLGMFPGDVVSADKEIPVNIILIPDFEQQSGARAADAPRLKLSKGSIDFGSFGGKNKKRDEITITNEGRTTLTIRSIQMLTAGLELSLNKQNIEPGGTAKLKVTAVAELLKGVRTRPRILMITNDPKDSKVVIPVSFEK